MARFEVEKRHLTAIQKRLALPGERGPFFVVVDRDTGQDLVGRYRSRSAAERRVEREEKWAL